MSLENNIEVLIVDKIPENVTHLTGSGKFYITPGAYYYGAAPIKHVTERRREYCSAQNFFAHQRKGLLDVLRTCFNEEEASRLYNEILMEAKVNGKEIIDGLYQKIKKLEEQVEEYKSRHVENET